MKLDYIKLIRGSYEAEGLPANFSENSLVPGYAFNVLNTLGLLYTPVADEAHLSKTNKKPQWPKGKPFAACLTHDVDEVSAYSLKQTLRALRSPFNGLSATAQKAKKLDRLVKNTIKSALFGFRKDPFHFYERWLFGVLCKKLCYTLLRATHCVCSLEKADSLFKTNSDKWGSSFTETASPFINTIS